MVYHRQQNLQIANSTLCQTFSKKKRVWRYEKGNHNPEIEEGQTTQWLKEKEKKDKQRSTKRYTEN